MVKNQLDKTFVSLKKDGRKALIAYLAAGYPKFTEQIGLIKELEASGVDVLELGIPFSDPVADGPTIQYASYQSLHNGTNVKKILKWVGSLKKEIRMPIVFMTYLNPIYAYGFEKFASDAQKAGITGLIIPDQTPEEAAGIGKALAKKNMHLIHLVAPTTPRARQKKIAKQSGGFLYAVSVTGVTGARKGKSFTPKTKNWLGSLKKISKWPVCVGFGISGADQIRSLRNKVDGFIVGSALIDIIKKNKAGRRKTELGRFVRSLAKECSRGR